MQGRRLPPVGRRLVGRNLPQAQHRQLGRGVHDKEGDQAARAHGADRP